MSSARLPGKVLTKVAGRPLLGYLTERLAHCQTLDSFVVATSIDHHDDPIAEFCVAQGFECYRGSLEDVADRLLQAAEHYGLKEFVRISADSPMLDTQIVARALAIAATEPFDLVTNVFPRSFPKGQSVEVVSTDALREVTAVCHEPRHREHVTSYFYEHAVKYRVRNFSNHEDLSSVQLSVDTSGDLEMFNRIVASMSEPHWRYGLSDVLRLRENSLPHS